MRSFDYFDVQPMTDCQRIIFFFYHYYLHRRARIVARCLCTALWENFEIDTQYNGKYMIGIIILSLYIYTITHTVLSCPAITINGEIFYSLQNIWWKEFRQRGNTNNIKQIIMVIERKEKKKFIDHGVTIFDIFRGKRGNKILRVYLGFWCSLEEWKLVWRYINLWGFFGFTDVYWGDNTTGGDV